MKLPCNWPSMLNTHCRPELFSSLARGYVRVRRSSAERFIGLMATSLKPSTARLPRGTHRISVRPLEVLPERLDHAHVKLVRLGDMVAHPFRLPLTQIL